MNSKITSPAIAIAAVVVDPVHQRREPLTGSPILGDDAQSRELATDRPRVEPVLTDCYQTWVKLLIPSEEAALDIDAWMAKGSGGQALA